VSADDLATVRERLAREVTGGAGFYVAVPVDESYVDDARAVEQVLSRLRRQIRPGVDVRLRVEWVGDRLLFVMGYPS
jgi:hypothetical protein